MSLKIEIEKRLNQFSTAPFLFVGSGISRRYLDLEGWEGLLQRFADLTSKPYHYYRATSGGSLPLTATEIAREFHEIWWSSETHSSSREEHESDCTSPESALKIEISRYMRDKSDGVVEDADVAKEIDALKQATVDGIITTNWDLFLENLFPDFTVYVGQDHLLFSQPKSIGEVYKIHGSCSEPNSLVLTQDDYDDFHTRNPYLAAKLLSVFVEHPVFFLGYSINDPNIITILKSIASCLTSANLDRLQNRLVVVQWDPEVTDFEISASHIVADDYAIPVLSVRTSTLLPVFEALSSTRRRFPARLLRQLKEHVY